MVEEHNTKLSKGRVLYDGRYRVVGPLDSGQGGFGCVYKIEENHPHLGRRVLALKQQLYEINDDSTNKRVRDSFRAEAKTLSDLRVQNTPIVHEIFEEAGSFFIVMDYIEGDNLDTIMKKDALSISESTHIIEKLLETVIALHTNSPRIIHRDIKPANVILKDKRIWLVDFGLARNSDLGTVLTGASRYFSPPEQQRGLSTKEAGDVYSIGATFYYMLCGEKPVDSLTRFNDFQDSDNDPLAKVTEKNQQVPEVIEKIIDKAMELNPDSRFGSAKEMLEELCEANRKVSDVEVLLKQGVRYAEEEDWDAAVTEFNQVLRIEPTSPKAKFHLGICYAKKGEEQKAMDLFDEVIELAPANADAFNQRGVLHLKNKDAKNAFDDLTRALALDDTHADFRFNRYQASMQIAENDLRSIVAKDSGPASEIRSIIGKEDYRSKEFRKFRKQANKILLRRFPKNWEERIINWFFYILLIVVVAGIFFFFGLIEGEREAKRRGGTSESQVTQ